MQAHLSSFMYQQHYLQTTIARYTDEIHEASTAAAPFIGLAGNFIIFFLC